MQNQGTRFWSGKFHWPLIVFSTLLTLFGLLAVASAGRGSTGDMSLAVRQSAFAGIGLVSMVVAGLVSYHKLRRWTVPLVGVSASLLVLVLTAAGSEVRGTQGWFRFGSFSFQPSEVAKLGLIVGLAALFGANSRFGSKFAALDLTMSNPGEQNLRKISKDQKRRDDEQQAITFAKSVFLLAVFSGLVVLQGETGTVLVYLALTIGIYFVAGLALKYLALLASTAIVGVYFVVDRGALPAIQADRFRSFWDPGFDPLGAGYHQNQALTAIGSGSFKGSGLFAGPQTQLGFLPDQHTDFIFSAIAEETGLLGAGTVVLLQSAILFSIYRVGNNSRDPFGKLLCVGVFSMFSFQVIQNIGMNLRLLPVTGIPLPLISYGGSSLTTFLVALGLVHSVHSHQTHHEYAEVLSVNKKHA